LSEDKVETPKGSHEIASKGKVSKDSKARESCEACESSKDESWSQLDQQDQQGQPAQQSQVAQPRMAISTSAVFRLVGFLCQVFRLHVSYISIGFEFQSVKNTF
jgi:hypothetical protein